ncbi:MAG: transposase [Burkholderiales bacterium]
MANDSTVYVGLDVHQDSITVARVGTGFDEPVVDVATIGTQRYAINRLINRLTGRGRVRAWQQSKRDVAKAKQRLKGFLLRNDIRYAGKASWSEAHRRWPGYPVAQALLAFRGVQRAVAYTVVAEAGDFLRFGHPRRFMAWIGLVPGEHSSGGNRRQGGITKTGNRWARTLLVEAAWAYRHTPKVSPIIE